MRYPGGKWRLAAFFERLIALNFQKPPVYVEPFAGGGSLALTLLFREVVSEIHLNDLDPAIHALWHSMLHDATRFIRLLESTPLTPAEWARQKAIFAKGLDAGRLALGFATFYLNRTNHSGILNGGMIGGKAQLGTWKLDARFNRARLTERIRRVFAKRTKIHLSNDDASDFLKEHNRTGNKLIYLDPPYYNAGQRLYLNAYQPEDHAALRDRVLKIRSPWVASYDTAPEIRALYESLRSRRVNILHTARAARQGREVMFFSPILKIPTLSRQGVSAAQINPG